MLVARYEVQGGEKDLVVQRVVREHVGAAVGGF